VELAISTQTPLVCEYGDGTTTTAVSAAEGCPRAPATGLFGAALNRTNRDDGLWELPLGRSLAFKIPLRATRPLSGIAGGTPSCGRQRGEFPCPREQAGDSLQVASHVLDGQGSPWLVPYNGLTVAPGPTSPQDSSTLLRRAPRSLPIARAVRGVPITVAVAADNSTVTASLRAPLQAKRRSLLARATVRRAQAGDLKMRLQPSRAARRALRRVRSVTATLRVTVRSPAGDRQTATGKIALRR
jgi:hypothetical protein